MVQQNILADRFKRWRKNPLHHSRQNEYTTGKKLKWGQLTAEKNPEIRKTDRAGEPGRFFSGERREEIKAQYTLHLLCQSAQIHSIACLH